MSFKNVSRTGDGSRERIEPILSLQKIEAEGQMCEFQYVATAAGMHHTPGHLTLKLPPILQHMHQCLHICTAQQHTAPGGFKHQQVGGKSAGGCMSARGSRGSLGSSTSRHF
eukprot:1157398-Pelagomonas_calceolata.AAC.2